MDNLLAILLLVLGFAIYFVAYLLIPWIVASSAKLQKATIDIIVLSNAVVVFILLQLINPNLTANLVMGAITIFIARKRMISKCLKSDNTICNTNTSLKMNPQMGKKWFIFYSKVRPWFVLLSTITLLISFIRDPITFANSAALLSVILSSILQTCLAYRVAIWSRRDYGTFVSVVEDVLFFETIIIPYQTAVLQHYQNGNTLDVTIVVGIILLILTYLLWYRLNIKYFHKRLFALPNVTPISVVQEKSSVSTTTPTLGNQPLQRTTQKINSIPTQPIQSEKPQKYCSRCGKPIDPSTKKCQGCGKQYFKGFTFKTVLVTMLCVLLVASCAGNIVLCLANVSLNEKYDALTVANSSFNEEILELQQSIDSKQEVIERLQKANTSLQSKIASDREILDFMNDHVVVVEDDGTNIYHKYGCLRFAGNSFWAFNTEAAIGRGYKPCSLCCD